MTELSPTELAPTQLSLAADFETATRDSWLVLVAKALKGGDFERRLVGRTYDGIRIEPLYTRNITQSESLAIVRGFVHGEAPRQGTATAAWDIAQRTTGTDPAAVNAAILEDLDGGASGIVLRFAAPGQAGLPVTTQAIARALDGVRLDWGVTVALDAGSAYLAATEAVLAALASSGRDPVGCAISLDADPLGTLGRTGGLPRDAAQSFADLGRLMDLTASLPNFRAGLIDGRPYHEAGASEAQELACLGATLIAVLRALEGTGHAPEKVLGRLGFALSADAQIFPTIAKLRAARRLIGRIAEACGAASAVSRLHLRVETSARMMARRDAYTNLLRTTIAASAATMGGANAITVLPFSWALGQPDALARRMARNTQIVLMEESNLGRVADPAGGSWYVEQLTTELAGKAWALLQEIEQPTSGGGARGDAGGAGMLAALQSGRIQAMIAKTAAERARNLATGREELIGVANYPQLAETAFTVVPHPEPDADGGDDAAIAVEPLTPRRAAEPLERLRDAADAHAKRTGQPPRVFLANLGTIPEFNARATFAQNFFAAGGIETLTNDGFANSADVGRAFAASGAKVACLCSSDANYGLLAEAAAQVLTGAGATHVYLAGRPPSDKPGSDKLGGDQPGGTLEAWRAAGIGSYIFIGCDAPDTLAKAHANLGVHS